MSKQIPAYIKMILEEDMNAGRSFDFSRGRIFAYDEDQDRESIINICEAENINFTEAWAGVNFQNAIKSCIKNMGFSQNINISNTNNTPYTSTTAVSPTA